MPGSLPLRSPNHQSLRNPVSDKRSFPHQRLSEKDCAQREQASVPAVRTSYILSHVPVLPEDWRKGWKMQWLQWPVRRIHSQRERRSWMKIPANHFYLWETVQNNKWSSRRQQCKMPSGQCCRADRTSRKSPISVLVFPAYGTWKGDLSEPLFRWKIPTQEPGFPGWPDTEDRSA